MLKGRLESRTGESKKERVTSEEVMIDHFLVGVWDEVCAGASPKETLYVGSGLFLPVSPLRELLQPRE